MRKQAQAQVARNSAQIDRNDFTDAPWRQGALGNHPQGTTSMLSPQEAEALAQVTVETYVSRCGAQNIDDARRAVIKLFSMAGIALVAIAGRERALEILEETKKNMSRPDLVARLEMVNRH